MALQPPLGGLEIAAETSEAGAFFLGIFCIVPDRNFFRIIEIPKRFPLGSVDAEPLKKDAVSLLRIIQ